MVVEIEHEEKSEQGDVHEDNIDAGKVNQEKESEATFQSLGLDERLCEVCKSLGWFKPTKIQEEALPVAFQGRDIIGLAETGSGKSAAFILPILQSLLENPRRLFALIISPTRELALQIQEQVAALGKGFQINSACLVGGMDMTSQSFALARKPHIIIATPGRLVDHLEKTKGFNLSALKFLVLDEADRILNMDFEKEIDKILEQIPRDRRTYLFSATMTKKVGKLQRASLKDPVKIEVSSKFQTVDHLKQFYCFIPAKYKDVYLVHTLNELSGNSFIVFCNTCPGTQRIALMLRNLGFSAIPINGKMTQDKRLAALNKFKAKTSAILIATDVASRGLDIPHVNIVINYDLPQHGKDYIHRVGRTARAGRYGKAITFVSQYDVENYQKIEHQLGQKLPLHETVEQEVMMLLERVNEAERLARIEQREMEDKSHKRKNGDSEDDDDEPDEHRHDKKSVKKFKSKLKKVKKVEKHHKKPTFRGGAKKNNSRGGFKKGRGRH